MALLQISIYTYSIIHLSFQQSLVFHSSTEKLIFGHYILSFSPPHHASSGITQITFLNAPSKSPYKQMQSLTRNNHITSNHLPVLLFTPSKNIFIRTFFHCSSVFLQQCKHCCLYQNHISVQPCIKDTRFAGAIRCLRASSTHPHFAFAQKIERAAKSATLPYAFYIFEVLMSPLRFGRCKMPLICGMVHRNAISDFHFSVESSIFASSEV